MTTTRMSNTMSYIVTVWALLVSVLCVYLLIADHPPLQVRQPCMAVSHYEDASGKFVEYTVRCLEYTGPVGTPR